MPDHDKLARALNSRYVKAWTKLMILAAVFHILANIFQAIYYQSITYLNLFYVLNLERFSPFPVDTFAGFLFSLIVLFFALAVMLKLPNE